MYDTLYQIVSNYTLYLNISDRSLAIVGCDCSFIEEIKNPSSNYFA